MGGSLSTKILTKHNAAIQTGKWPCH